MSTKLPHLQSLQCSFKYLQHRPSPETVGTYVLNIELSEASRHDSAGFQVHLAEVDIPYNFFSRAVQHVFSGCGTGRALEGWSGVVYIVEY